MKPERSVNLIGSANEVAITAIISATTTNEVTNKQILPIIREKSEHSWQSCCNLDSFILEPEKQVKKYILK